MVNYRGAGPNYRSNGPKPKAAGPVFSLLWSCRRLLAESEGLKMRLARCSDPEEAGALRARLEALDNGINAAWDVAERIREGFDGDARAADVVEAHYLECIAWPDVAAENRMGYDQAKKLALRALAWADAEAEAGRLDVRAPSAEKMPTGATESAQERRES